MAATAPLSSDMKEAILQYIGVEDEATAKKTITIWGPSSVERAKGKLAASRVVKLLHLRPTAPVQEV
ncbi:hypothetical protein GOP47_0005916 [Adiantum capillus-veneris]|uniref:Uncharacterized protein n=1 Tax=Adiantum capillus-veneris TaxID=13818 RepID=A0A9D4V2G9_ADICA|nr:hypothetical protein GOP47_0005916 [Adiantum capillus-veneris]